MAGKVVEVPIVSLRACVRQPLWWRSWCFSSVHYGNHQRVVVESR